VASCWISGSVLSDNKKTGLNLQRGRSSVTIPGLNLHI